MLANMYVDQDRNRRIKFYATSFPSHSFLARCIRCTRFCWKKSVDGLWWCICLGMVGQCNVLSGYGVSFSRFNATDRTCRVADRIVIGFSPYCYYSALSCTV